MTRDDNTRTHVFATVGARKGGLDAALRLFQLFNLAWQQMREGGRRVSKSEQENKSRAQGSASCCSVLSRARPHVGVLGHLDARLGQLLADGPADQRVERAKDLSARDKKGQRRRHYWLCCRVGARGD